MATCIFLFFCNEPELGVGIDPGMALTPLSSSIGWGLNPRPSDCEPSAVPLDHRPQLSIPVKDLCNYLNSVIYSSC